MEGIIPVWKPRGMTSHDCVFKLRKILKTKKVGHSGTLDPDVDGVLPICVGKGTKVIEYIQDSNKIYMGEVTLGFSTETEDVSGEVVEITPVLAEVSVEEIDKIMKEMTGEITQIPPMYSAVKVNGRRLYDYARNGETVERPERKAMIYSYNRTTEPVFDAGTQQQKWRFDVDCGKGTYVRTLAVDTGKKLGYAAHMSDLTRIKSGGFTKEECFTMEEIALLMDLERQDKFLYPIERAVEDFVQVNLTEEMYGIIKNGSVVESNFFDNLDVNEPIALFYQEKIVSIYGKHPTKSGLLKPIKVLRND
ncbi:MULTISPECIES: tRNA pseudouridine(55) synthase TruB [Vagococcus]|uniref:tRNA pseudouridine synthase B n=1 Tax=Vagococcus fluvialis bH819 TaxID=1255619 RepID=A0A1X6WR47_9ENTE|nr:MULTISPECIES: tRNA pseudouridine(55) synthase TruB [Vagococcus]SLM86728.1 tRNA pseudouridine synthase B [Vagococcus fluvialis bH819]HCM90935.1 tRNA pseudouridine(55) synthase TruB [Vagococcus sp.]